MTLKRAFTYETQQKQFEEYVRKIKMLITRSNMNPFEVDYLAELKKLYAANPKDKALIRKAEQEAYIQSR